MNTQNSANAPVIYLFQDSHELRVVTIDGEPWFIAKDVAEILGYSDTQAMTRRLDEDEKGMFFLHTLGGDQQVTIINESGLYTAVLGSNKPEAKPFKRWITRDVLPSIRKHGYYAKPELGFNFGQELFPKGYPANLPPFQRINATLYAQLERRSPVMADAYLAECGLTADYLSEQVKKINKTPVLALGQLPQDNIVMLVMDFALDWQKGFMSAPYIPCLGTQATELFSRWLGKRGVRQKFKKALVLEALLKLPGAKMESLLDSGGIAYAPAKNAAYLPPGHREFHYKQLSEYHEDYVPYRKARQDWLNDCVNQMDKALNPVEIKS